MTNTKLLKDLRTYQKTASKKTNKKHRAFFSDFEKIMIYRTTKTENPETTLKMVEKVLNK